MAEERFIKNLTGIVKYIPAQCNPITIPFQLENVELESEPKTSEEATSKKELVRAAIGLYEVEIMCNRAPDIRLGDRIKVHPRTRASEGYLLDYLKNRSFKLSSSQIDVIGDDGEVFASYFRSQ